MELSDEKLNEFRSLVNVAKDLIKNSQDFRKANATQDNNRSKSDKATDTD